MLPLEVANGNFPLKVDLTVTFGSQRKAGCVFVIQDTILTHSKPITVQLGCGSQLWDVAVLIKSTTGCS